VGAFGEKLRKQREQQGIGLDAISGTTKISTRMLRALEEEHFDKLPGGVFNKGFVRAYARQVGLNEEEAVADYLDAVRQNQLQASSLSPDFRDLPGNDLHGDDLNGHGLHSHDLPDRDVPSNPAGSKARNNRSQPLLANDRRKQSRRSEDQRNEARHSEARNKEARHKEDRRPKDLSPPPDSPTSGLAAQLPWGKLAVALLLVTFALALWNSRRHREPPATAQPAASSPQSPAPVTAPVSGSAPTLTVAKASPQKTLSSGKFSPGTISTASAPSPATNASITLPVPPPPSKAAPTAPTQADSRGSVPAPSANAPRTNPTLAETPASAAAAKPPSSFSLLIRAEETSWVSITADGKPVAQETLIAPAHTSVRATGEVVVKAGNAAGISFQLNGEDIPAQGNEGEVKTYVFDAAGFRILPQTQSPAAIR
jgi:cytoskeletal protein RodZ